MKVGWDTDIPAYGKFFTTLHMPDASDQSFKSYGNLLRLTTSPANAAALVQAYFEADVLDAVCQVRCPTLVLHAREDAIIPFEEGRLVASLIPGARFVPIESRNHILQETEPAWQQLVSELDSFLPVSSTDKIGLSLAELTPRERMVIELIARGLDNHRSPSSSASARKPSGITFPSFSTRSEPRAERRRWPWHGTPALDIR